MRSDVLVARVSQAIVLYRPDWRFHKLGDVIELDRLKALTNDKLGGKSQGAAGHQCIQNW